LWAILEDSISNCGLREIDHVNPFKRKQVPIFHGFRKFFTKQLMDSEPKVDKAIVELLLGHDIGLTGRYYKPTEQDLLNEYLKAVPLLTISDEERLKVELKENQIESSQYESLRAAFEKLNNEVSRLKQQQK
jgi:hypothetical protein